MRPCAPSSTARNCKSIAKTQSGLPEVDDGLAGEAAKDPGARDTDNGHEGATEREAHVGQREVAHEVVGDGSQTPIAGQGVEDEHVGDGGEQEEEHEDGRFYGSQQGGGGPAVELRVEGEVTPVSPPQLGVHAVHVGMVH